MKRDSCDTSPHLTVHARAHIRHKQEVLSQPSRVRAQLGEIDENEKLSKVVFAAVIEAEDLAAAILAHASGAVRWYAEDGDIREHGRDGDRAWAAMAMAKLKVAEESMLRAYAFQERPDVRRVVDCAVSRGIRAEVARFALVKLLQPSRFAAGAMREHRPKGRRSDIDREIRAAEALYREWLRDAALAFLLVYAIEARPQTCGEIQNPGIRQSESEDEAITKCLRGEPKASVQANGQRTPVTIPQRLPVPVPTKEN